MSQVNSARVLPARTSSVIPQNLTLQFTGAHDLGDVCSLFEGERKASFDPNGKIRKRTAQELEAPVSSGSAILARDETGLVRFFAMATDHVPNHYDGMVTEIGAVMSDVGGFRLTQVASAMLALKESIRLREQNPCFQSHGVHALVANDNAAAKKVFNRDLQWQTIECGDRRDVLFETQQKYDCPDARAARSWLMFSGSAYSSARSLVMSTIANGVLRSRNDDRIPVCLDPVAYNLV